MCKGLLFIRDRCINAYCFCVYLTLGLIFPWIFELHIQPRRHEEQLHEQQLLNVVTDLCHFILHEVVYVREHFVHPEYELATDKIYEGLHQ
jgi:hypothetical protein